MVKDYTVVILEVRVRFRSPVIGKPTTETEEHYNGRRVRALVNGGEVQYVIKKEDVPFGAEEEEIEEAVLVKYKEENRVEDKEE